MAEVEEISIFKTEPKTSDILQSGKSFLCAECGKWISEQVNSNFSSPSTFTSREDIHSKSETAGASEVARKTLLFDMQ